MKTCLATSDKARRYRVPKCYSWITNTQHEDRMCGGHICPSLRLYKLVRKISRDEGMPIRIQIRNNSVANDGTPNSWYGVAIYVHQDDIKLYRKIVWSIIGQNFTTWGEIKVAIKETINTYKED